MKGRIFNRLKMNRKILHSFSDEKRKILHSFVDGKILHSFSYEREKLFNRFQTKRKMLHSFFFFLDGRKDSCFVCSLGLSVEGGRRRAAGLWQAGRLAGWLVVGRASQEEEEEDSVFRGPALRTDVDARGSRRLHHHRALDPRGRRAAPGLNVKSRGLHGLEGMQAVQTDRLGILICFLLSLSTALTREFSRTSRLIFVFSEICLPDALECLDSERGFFEQRETPHTDVERHEL